MPLPICSEMQIEPVRINILILIYNAFDVQLINIFQFIRVHVVSDI